MQLQADLLGCPVEVAAERETTALGAAALAGRTKARVRVGRRYEPRGDRGDIAAARAAWREALRRPPTRSALRDPDRHPPASVAGAVRRGALARERARRACEGGKLEIQGDTVWDVDLDAHRVETPPGSARPVRARHGRRLAAADSRSRPAPGRATAPSSSRPGRTASSRSRASRGSCHSRPPGRGTGSPGSSVSALELLDLPALAPRIDALARSRRLSVRPSRHGDRAPGQARLVAGGRRLRRRRCRPPTRRGCLHGVEHWPDARRGLRDPRGRRAVPDGAPVVARRRGALAIRPRIWLDSASYGSRALDFTMSALGIDRMLFGSDAPIVDPAPHVAYRRVLRAGCGRPRCSRRIRSGCWTGHERHRELRPRARSRRTPARTGRARRRSRA